MSNSTPWCELRHYLGRLHSFRQAAETIISASARWPALFQDFHVTPIPSSEPLKRPLRDPIITAARIIRNMSQNGGHQTCIAQAEEMQKFNLDEIIQHHVRSKAFRPIVHSEVLLHNYLLARGLSHPSHYWNGWKYIGSSKPTCRLCFYYFSEHPDQMHVRQTHHNLYRNWQLPNAVAHPEGPVEIQRPQLLARLTLRMRDDARRTLNERCSPGRRHDSNTYSTWPDGLSRQWGTETCSFHDIGIRPSIESYKATTQNDAVPGWEADSAVDLGDDDDGGVSLL